MANTSSPAKRPAEKQDATPSAQPVARFGDGTVSAAVFKNTRSTKSGDTFDSFSISIRRSYRKSDGSFGTSHSFDAKEVGLAIEALQQCEEYIKGEQNQNK